MEKTNSPRQRSLPDVSGRRLFASPPDRQAQERGQTEKLTQYRRDYWQNYKQQIKRVFGTVDPIQHAQWKTLAARHGRTVWGQIYACALAYVSGQTVVSTDVLNAQKELTADLRRIGNNLNQAVRLGHIKAQKDGRLIADVNDDIGQSVLAAFEKLEKRICQFEADIKILAPSNISEPSHDC